MILRKYIYLFIFALLIIAEEQLYSQTEEYKIKAAFIEKFTHYIDWHGKESSDNNFIIGILGQNPFGSYLKNNLSNTKLFNKNVIIKYYSDLNDIDCDLLFISNSESYRIKAIVQHLKNKPILMIGDTEGFSKNGVHINMFVHNNNIRFSINESSFKKSGLSVSYKLLQLAMNVY